MVPSAKVTESGNAGAGRRDGCGNLGLLYLGTFTGRSHGSDLESFQIHGVQGVRKNWICLFLNSLWIVFSMLCSIQWFSAGSHFAPLQGHLSVNVRRHFCCHISGRGRGKRPGLLLSIICGEQCPGQLEMPVSICEALCKQQVQLI